MTDYLYKTNPYPHQDREFMRSRDHITWAHFLEQRTGKTKLNVDTAAYNYERGKIDGMVVVAPPGVHAQWFMDEIPAHMPDRIPWNGLVYRAGKAPKTFAKQLEQLCQMKGLAVLCINTQAVITQAGKAAVEKFLHARKTLFIMDESADIRTPGAKTTKTVIKLGQMAIMRRILAGVPAPEGPMDLYSQYRFLHPRILGFKNFFEYKLRYAEWDIIERSTMRRVRDQELIDRMLKRQRLDKGYFMLMKKDDAGRPRYRNLEELEAKMAIRTSRVTQQEAFPHLPPKQYQKFYLDLNEEQVRLYNQILEDSEATIGDRTLTIKYLISRFIRLQQVICGYLPMPIAQELPEDFDWFGEGPDPGEIEHEIVRIPGADARMQVLDEILRLRAGDPAIVWARFKPDIDLLMHHLEAEGIHAARYDGSVSRDLREYVKKEFQAGHIPVLVGNQKAGGTGLTLKPAQTVIYYSNYYGLLPRAQSEDRPIHGELTRPVLYADIVARTTIEEKLVAALQFKKDIFQELMGDRDRLADWFGQAA